MRLPVEESADSATKIMPAEFTAIALGNANCASVPIPSRAVLFLLPARIVTTPLDIARERTSKESMDEMKYSVSLPGSEDNPMGPLPV